LKILDFGRDRETQEGMSQVTLRNSEGRPKDGIRIQTRDSGMDIATGQREKQCGVDFATEPSHSTPNIQQGYFSVSFLPVASEHMASVKRFVVTSVS
jgi:hypothetical protein